MALGGRTTYAVAALGAAAVVASGAFLYWKIASREAPAPAVSSNPHRADAAAATPGQAPGAAPSMEAATEGLARRLEQNGGSADEWALLARSYVHLKRYPEAVDAFGRALELSPGDQSLIAAQAAARQAAGLPSAR